MSDRERLAAHEIESRVGALDGWRVADDAIARDFEFPDFVRAFGFMSSVALAAERMNHHPDWSNSYGRVNIRLTSHDVGGISGRDIRLAARIDELYATHRDGPA